MGSKNKNDKGKPKISNKDMNKKKVIEDPRFQKLHYDPKFQTVPKNKHKVQVDSRFKSMFTNKGFSTSSSAPVDKRGKVKAQSENDLRGHYHFDSEDDAAEETLRKKKESKKLVKGKIEEEDDDVDVDVNDDEVESGDESSESGSVDSEAESSDTTSSSDADLDDADDTSAEVENVPLIEEETRRLAVVNMDWSQVKAVDLLVMLSSCLPKGGQIKSVAVYPSEFGLKRMEEEAVRGPAVLFEDDKQRGEGDSSEDDDDSEEDGNDDDEDAVSDQEDADQVSNDEDADEISESEDADEISDNEDIDEDNVHEESGSEDEDVNDGEDYSDDEDEDDDEIDTEKLRAYEKSRLRYYYAVVECDSIATADYIYKACDGIEFERSSNVMDLRFIPDSMEFKHKPRDVATEAPAAYEGLDFQTRALQQSNVALSWDDDEPHRVKTLRRNYDEKQLAEMELNEFLASDESDSDEDENGDQDPSEKKKKKIDMYRALVQSGEGTEEEDEGQNMEVTFATGLEDISKKIIEKKEKGSETVFEAYLRKKKEKKNARKNKPKTSSDDDSNESDDQNPEKDPDDFFEGAPSAVRRKKDTQHKKDEKTLLEKATEASQAELELLLADENGTNKKLKGYNMKQKKRKGRKGEDTPDESNLPTVDTDDPRFSALFKNPGFALDPTDPQFKRSATYYRQVAQRQQKGSNEHEDVEPVEPSIRKKEEKLVDSSQKDKHELSAMVKSLKMKSKELKVQSNVKRKEKMESNGPTIGKKHKLPGSDRATKKAKTQNKNL